VDLAGPRRHDRAHDLMYGWPTAPGGFERPTSPATARIVTTYGSMSMNTLGTGEPMIDSWLPRFEVKPNRSAASAALTGFHCPKITAASAMYPAPPVMFSPKATPAPIV